MWTFLVELRGGSTVTGCRRARSYRLWREQQPLNVKTGHLRAMRENRREISEKLASAA